MRSRPAAWPVVIALAACQPATTRPPYPAVAQAATVEVRLPPGEATQQLAERLQADSIPATRIVLGDAWFETRWFDPTTGRVTGRRPIGSSVVLLRGWADPTQPGSSKLTVETLYRPVADPSLPERELDRQVPRGHPVAVKVRAALEDLVKRYGGPPPPQSERKAAEPEEEPAQDAGPPPSEEPPDQESPDQPSP